MNKEINMEAQFDYLRQNIMRMNFTSDKSELSSMYDLASFRIDQIYRANLERLCGNALHSSTI